MAKRILVKRGFLSTASGQALSAASHLFKLQPSTNLPADVVLPGIGMVVIEGDDYDHFDVETFHKKVSNGFKFPFLLFVKPSSLDSIQEIQSLVSLKTQVHIVEHVGELIEFMQLVLSILNPQEVQGVNVWIEQEVEKRVNVNKIYEIAATMPVQPNEARVLMDSVGSFRQLASLDVTMLLEKTPLSDRDVNAVASFLRE